MRLDKKHWTHQLFVEEADIYLPFLEQAMDRADAEADVVEGLFHQNQVCANGRVLDVACGIGRHSIPLARRGYQVTGIDLSPLFIEEARKRAAEAGVGVRFVVGDMQEVQSLVGAKAPFDAVISMFTSHGYYGRDSDLCLFRQLRCLSVPGAVLVVLTAHRDWLVHNFDPHGLDKAGSVRILQSRTFDPATSCLHNDWEFYEGGVEAQRLRLKLQMEICIYNLHELKGVLEEAGWRCIRGFGSDRGPSFQLGKLTCDSKTMWVVARADAPG